MRYEGNTCPGCGRVFVEDDDVVVCPECATAQHRECYNKNKECVNAHLHGESFQWEPEKGVTQHSASTLINNDKKNNKRTFECPNCGNMCDPDMECCDKCGTKFVLFGVNLAKKIQLEREKNGMDAQLSARGFDADGEKDSEGDNENENGIPRYKAPFTLGTGEGFGYDEKKDNDNQQEHTSDDVNRVSQSIIEELTGQNKKVDGEEDVLFFSGPYRADDKIGGVSANAIGTFVRNEALRYVEKFRKISSGGITFNWGAFFFSPYWFFYRKLIKPGIIFTTVELIIAIFSTFFSYEMFAAISEFDMASAGTMSEEALYEFVMTQLAGSALPILLCMLAMMGVRIASGVFADRLYKKYVVENVKVMQKKSNMNEAAAYALKNGGASILYGIASFFACELFGYAIGMFFT